MKSRIESLSIHPPARRGLRSLRVRLALAATALGTAFAAQAAPLYTVVEGTKVDAETMKGFRAWRTGACDRCHGANQEGMVGPSLINSLKTLSKADFIAVVKDGRLDKGMPSFGTNAAVMGSIDGLYAYLKGRSDGAITKARVEELPAGAAAAAAPKADPKPEPKADAAAPTAAATPATPPAAPATQPTPSAPTGATPAVAAGAAAAAVAATAAPKAATHPALKKRPVKRKAPARKAPAR